MPVPPELAGLERASARAVVRASRGEASPRLVRREGTRRAPPVGERGAPFRRSTFGRKWRRARAQVGLPEGFRCYDLRHTGHTLSTQSGATLKDTMVRAGQSSEKAALIYQHSDDVRQQEVAGGIDAKVRRLRGRATGAESG